MTRVSVAGVVVVAVVATVLGSGREALAQSLGTPTAPGGAELPDWMIRWSPIALSGDMPRELPTGALSIPSVLTNPMPRVGAFWTAGNPAGMAWDVRDSYVQFRLGARNDDGSYRRPLDPRSDGRLTGGALGWRNLGDGAAIGRVQIDQVTQARPVYADHVLPHTSNPFVLLDTLGDDVSALVARLDGAGGLRVGDFGIGLGLGYDAREVRTLASPVPIQYRVSAAAVAFGLGYELFGGLLQLGTYGRWEQVAQRALITASGADARLVVLRGYSNPAVIDLGGASVATYAGKTAREAHSVGGSLAGTVSRVAWSAYAHRSDVSEQYSVGFFGMAATTDDWNADGWTAGFAAQVTLVGGRVVPTVSGRYRTLAGQATRSDLETPHFSVNQSDWRVMADARLTLDGNWTAALRLGTGRSHWRARDSLASAGSDIKAWAPWAAIEVARRLPAGFAASLGAGWAQYAPWGSIPDPVTLSEGYRAWIGPELSLYGTKAVTVSGTGTLLWRTGSGLEIWVRANLASLSGRPGAIALPATPEGSRTRHAVTVGLTMLP